MSYFAAAVVRDGGGWTAAEVNLRGATDVDEVADRLRDVEPDADLSLLFVEADDAYLVVLRLDEGEDLRVFGSDSAYAEESRLGALLVGDLKGSVTGFDDTEEPRASAGSGDDDSEQPAVDPEADPVGDADLLADLGISAQRLLRLCAHEGMLPADVTAEVCQVLGCADEVEELRGV
ncbi:tRNA adenosine deaminase-associated protein [Micromonospora carbonacea]|jgi:putative tRNA adenosine deaminase-associated protein|uniref:Putative tRNA adenosine deaminase-associated protein n=1 Tax=Micromonospora carbonacea TaxID=47853 RepID=A0A1C4TVV9_9ACTN|nr:MULTISPECIES: tRNA adenosine deaminase-associated protein [Micromonospora]MDG4815947.1 tRNA adenosine deaminase-associated protein [Micromonospora sp. WMMD956]WFE58473.1 tRNA adenosine deaminase-associated protein [Micromonospora sp. WMMD712]SCE63578.1 putative tRNA adenosine deaminase-associated protein [Micromonospora carbonacea]